MKRVCIIVLLLSLVSTLFPVPVRAGYRGSVRISGKETFNPSLGEYLIDELIIEKGAELTVEAGTLILMGVGGRIEVHGSLRIFGTNDLPVTVTSAHHSMLWEGITTYPTSSQITFRAVEFRNFQNPITLQGTNVVLDRVQLTDGVHNLIVLGNQSTTHPGPYTWKKLVFANRLRGAIMEESGVLVLGSNAIVRIASLRFADTRPFHDPNVLYGIRAEGEHREISVSSPESDDGCRFRFRPYEHMNLIIYELDRDSCQIASLPVVFVPGYGSSINLNKLSQADDRSPDHNGWRFFKLLTPQYIRFLDDLTLNGIPYEVAYYDWRLTAVENASAYLQPAIDRALKKYKTKAVHLVAHSYGGLISRAYIQSNSYRGDVVKLVQMATPNKGAAKAYPVWEGGELPEDWQAMTHLIRLYRYERPLDYFSDRGVIQHYFPSVRDMLPIYPALIREGQGFLDPEQLVLKNNWLLEKRDTESTLTSRVQVATLYSQSELTQETLQIGPPQNGFHWPDGPVLDSDSGKSLSGDSTVPMQSVTIPTSTPIQIEGSHLGLVATAAAKVLSYLFPKLQQKSQQVEDSDYQSPLWISLDCAVDVTVRLPDGRIRHGHDADSPNRVGEVEISPKMQWFVFPRQTGNYQISIRSLQEGEVRLWVNNDEIRTYSLTTGESIDVQYTVNDNGTGSYREESNTNVASIPYSPLTVTPSFTNVLKLLDTTYFFQMYSFPNPTKSLSLQTPRIHALWLASFRR